MDSAGQLMNNLAKFLFTQQLYRCGSEYGMILNHPERYFVDQMQTSVFILANTIPIKHGISRIISDSVDQ